MRLYFFLFLCFLYPESGRTGLCGFCGGGEVRQCADAF